jgi:hypothetical protein
MTDDQLAICLDAALVVEDRRDWLDVQRRARPRRRWLTRPPGLLAAALVVAGGGSLALGLGAKLLDKDVPPKVRSQLQHALDPPEPADGAPPWVGQMEHLGKIVKGSEHRVLRVQTPKGPISLYVARTTRGGYCVMTQGPGAGGGGCNSTGKVFPRYPIDYGLMASRGSQVLDGHAGQKGAYAVSIRFRGLPAKRIVLTEGWFLYPIPRARRAAGKHPIVAVDVLSQSGHRLATLHDPLGLNRPKPHFTTPIPSSVRLLSSQELPNDGGTVTLWDGRDREGHRCFRHLRNGKSQQSPVWECRAETNRYWFAPPTGRHIPVRWEMGLRNDGRKGAEFGHAYAYGWAAPPVVSLKLRFQDGSQRAIPLHDGDYLYVVPKANWPAGHRPSILLGYDANGRQVFRQFLYPRQHCIYPGHDPLCKNLGMGTG